MGMNYHYSEVTPQKLPVCRFQAFFPIHSVADCPESPGYQFSPLLRPLNTLQISAQAVLPNPHLLPSHFVSSVFSPLTCSFSARSHHPSFSLSLG